MASSYVLIQTSRSGGVEVPRERRCRECLWALVTSTFPTKAIAATLWHHYFRFYDQSDSCDPVALVTSTFPTKAIAASGRVE